MVYELVFTRPHLEFISINSTFIELIFSPVVQHLLLISLLRQIRNYRVMIIRNNKHLIYVEEAAATRISHLIHQDEKRKEKKNIYHN